MAPPRDTSSGDRRLRLPALRRLLGRPPSDPFAETGEADDQVPPGEAERLRTELREELRRLAGERGTGMSSNGPG